MKIFSFLLTLTLTLTFWTLAGCGTGAKQVQGTYEVTGSSGVVASITYAGSGQGSTSYAVSQTLPWQTTFNGYESEGSYTGSYVNLVAVIDLPSGSCAMTATILESGKVFQTGTVYDANNPVTLLGYF